jgi:nitrogen fixation protein FixH
VEEVVHGKGALWEQVAGVERKPAVECANEAVCFDPRSEQEVAAVVGVVEGVGQNVLSVGEGSSQWYRESKRQSGYDGQVVCRGRVREADAVEARG